MRIVFEALREKGWHVEADHEGVTIQGLRAVNCLNELTLQLAKETNLTAREADQLVDEFYGKIEAAMILKDIS